MVIEYKYFFDSIAYEVFPPEVYNDPFVVYHGTSSKYSSHIEETGLITGSTPFDLAGADELVSILELDGVRAYDTPIGVMNAAQGLRNYIQYVRSGQARLSLSYLSYYCTLFASGPLKGGQIIDTIRRAREILSTALENNVITNAQITPAILAVFAEIDSHDFERGVIYAVKLPESLVGVTIENFVIYSTLSVPADKIIGKVYIPNDYDANAFDRVVTSKKNKEKLQMPKGLGAQINRKEMQGTLKNFEDY
jgi:hypothetical protein